MNSYLRVRFLLHILSAFFSIAMVLAGGHVVHAAQEAEPTRQEKAQARAAERVAQIEEVRDEDPLRRSQRLRQMGLSVKDIRQTYFVLESPIIKEREDHYAGVRFNHAQHAASVDDCSVCHHKRPEQDVEFSPNPELVRCSACHQHSFDTEYPERLGLKAAYHQRCIGCHEEENRGPQVCADCHLEQVPEHKDLVELPDDPDPLEVTAECLRCHAEEAEHFKHTAHWRWRGHSGRTPGPWPNATAGKP
ncbi:MAG: cytochrome c3 family protein [Thermodesulfobacteriota bacterium]